ncbi:Nn.00g045560.m01.CDS01 [Neocucurbitaria sp. VM-36]
MSSFPWFLTFAISFLARCYITQASFNDQVLAAAGILRDLPEDLASDYCSDIAYKPTKTRTLTDPAATSTAILPPAPDTTHTSPWVITVTSTTTITYHTTSTITVAPTTPAKRSEPKFLREAPGEFDYQRATWCSDYNAPCRLVQFDLDVLAEACRKYLDGSQEEGVSPAIAQAMWDWQYGAD